MLHLDSVANSLLSEVQDFGQYRFCVLLTKSIFVRFQIFTSVTMKNAFFLDVVPCRSYVSRRFGGTYRLHLQSRKIHEREKKKGKWAPSLFLYSWAFSTGGSVCSNLLTLVPRSRIFLPWRWRRYVPPKHRFTQHLHCATSQKTEFFKNIFVIYSFYSG
jgi:hypothetical protein